MHAFCEEKGYVCGFIPLVGSTQRDGRDRDRVWWVMGQSLSEEEKRPIELGASPSDANYVLIFMHGLGDTGFGFSDTFRYASGKLSHFRFVLPTADVRPVTINMGFQMPAWYDIFGLSEDSPEDEDGIKKSAEQIMALIQHEEEEHNIPSENILLGGFSQGGAVAMYTALTSTKKLGGLVLMSSYLPLNKTFPEAASKHCAHMPAFQGHGELDNMVPFRFGKLTCEKLKELELQVDFHPYPGVQHTLAPTETDDMIRWLQEHFPAEN